jgi:uncharacterized Rossmann fold enzyme
MGVVPGAICTDFDGNSNTDIEKEILTCEKGEIVIIHAHEGKISISLKNMGLALNDLLQLPRQSLLARSTILKDYFGETDAFFIQWSSR